MRYCLLICLALLCLGCEKDPEIAADVLAVKSLENHLRGYSEAQVTNNFVVFAGNHHSFEEQTEGEDLHILLDAPNDATDFRLFQSDSLQDEDSTAYYLERNFTKGLAYQGFMTRLSLPMPPKEQWIRVSCATADSLYLSDPIRLPGSDRQTSHFEEFSDAQEVPGKATLRWNDGPLTPRFVLLFTDRSGDVFCGITTELNRFRFYDLRNIETNLTPDLYDPQLVVGEHYEAILFGISREGWLDRFGKLTFVHE